MNVNGELVKPTPESISASASGEIPADTRTSTTNSSAKGAYPISCFTWILIVLAILWIIGKFSG